MEQAIPQPCIMEWKWRKKTYQGCAKPPKSYKVTKSFWGQWCPTEVDSDGNFVTPKEFDASKFVFCKSKYIQCLTSSLS